MVGWLDILFYITDQTGTCAQSYDGDGLKYSYINRTKIHKQKHEQNALKRETVDGESRQLKDNGEVRQYYLRIVGKEAWRDNSFSYVQQHSDGIGGITYT